MTQAAVRIRQAATRKPREKLTALLHYVTPDALRWGLPRAEALEAPVVEDQQVDPGDAPQQVVDPDGIAVPGEFGDQFGNAAIEDGALLAVGLMGEHAGDEGFPGSGCAELGQHGAGDAAPGAAVDDLDDPLVGRAAAVVQQPVDEDVLAPKRPVVAALAVAGKAGGLRRRRTADTPRLGDLARAGERRAAHQRQARVRETVLYLV